MLIDKDLEEVLVEIINNTPSLASETLSILQAGGRVNAENIYAERNLPDCNLSAVDGYAVANILENGAESFLITGHINLGEVAKSPLNYGEAMGVATGGNMPEGTVAVIPHENTEARDNRLYPREAIKIGNNIKDAGEDYKTDELLLAQNQVLGAGEISLLAAFGKTAVEVYKEPRVAVLSLSENVVAWEETPSAGLIRDSNGPLLSALVMQDGGITSAIKIATQEKGSLKEIAQALLKQADVLILTGGTYSEGKNDALDLMEDLGAKTLYWGVPIQPGSHTGAALVGSSLIFALSGNPASCAVGYHLFVSPALKAMQGLDPYPKRIKAVCTNGFAKKTGTRRFVRGFATYDNKGWQVTVQPGQKPSMIRSLINCNALIDLPPKNPPVEIGEEVEIIILNKTFM